MSDADPLDRMFVEDRDDRPDEIVVDELTTMDTDEFVDRLEAVARASEVVTTMAEDLERLRQTGLSDEDARDLIFGRNSKMRKGDIEAIFDALDAITTGRADRPTQRLVAEVSDLTLTETGELMDELDRLRRRYGSDQDA